MLTKGLSGRLRFASLICVLGLSFSSLSHNVAEAQTPDEQTEPSASEVCSSGLQIDGVVVEQNNAPVLVSIRNEEETEQEVVLLITIETNDPVISQSSERMTVNIPARTESIFRIDLNSPDSSTNPNKVTVEIESNNFHNLGQVSAVSLNNSDGLGCS